MATDPIDAARQKLVDVSVYVTRGTMQAAIDAYEAAVAIQRQCDEPGCTAEATCGFAVAGGYRRTCGAHLASEGVQREAARRAQGRKLYGDEEFSVSIPHPAPASPQTPQTACGGSGDVEVHTIEGWVAVLATEPQSVGGIDREGRAYWLMVDGSRVFEPPPVAERGLTVDEGGE